MKKTITPQPPSERALQLHRRVCQAQEAGYLDPDSGLFVLTSHHLRQRATCCGKGCRHCPWPPEAQKKAGRPEDAPAWPWP